MHAPTRKPLAQVTVCMNALRDHAIPNTLHTPFESMLSHAAQQGNTLFLTAGQLQHTPRV